MLHGFEKRPLLERLRDKGGLPKGLRQVGGLGGRYEDERDLAFDESLGHAETLAANHVDIE
jgi:hypothetical protein